MDDTCNRHVSDHTMHASSARPHQAAQSPRQETRHLLDRRRRPRTLLDRRDAGHDFPHPESPTRHIDTRSQMLPTSSSARPSAPAPRGQAPRRRPSHERPGGHAAAHHHHPGAGAPKRSRHQPPAPAPLPPLPPFIPAPQPPPAELADFTCLDADLLGRGPPSQLPALFSFTGADVVENIARFADSMSRGSRRSIGRRDGRTLLITAWHTPPDPTAPQSHADYTAHASNCRALAEHYDQWPQTLAALARTTGLAYRTSHADLLTMSSHTVAASLAANRAQLPLAAATRWAAFADSPHGLARDALLASLGDPDATCNRALLWGLTLVRDYPTNVNAPVLPLAGCILGEILTHIYSVDATAHTTACPNRPPAPSDPRLQRPHPAPPTDALGLPTIKGSPAPTSLRGWQARADRDIKLASADAQPHLVANAEITVSHLAHLYADAVSDLAYHHAMPAHDHPAPPRDYTFRDTLRFLDADTTQPYLRHRPDHLQYWLDLAQATAAAAVPADAPPTLALRRIVERMLAPLFPDQPPHPDHAQAAAWLAATAPPPTTPCPACAEPPTVSHFASTRCPECATDRLVHNSVCFGCASKTDDPHAVPNTKICNDCGHMFQFACTTAQCPKTSHRPYHHPRDKALVTLRLCAVIQRKLRIQVQALKDARARGDHPSRSARADTLALGLALIHAQAGPGSEVDRICREHPKFAVLAHGNLYNTALRHDPTHHMPAALQWISPVGSAIPPLLADAHAALADHPAPTAAPPEPPAPAPTHPARIAVIARCRSSARVLATPKRPDQSDLTYALDISLATQLLTWDNHLLTLPDAALLAASNPFHAPPLPIPAQAAHDAQPDHAPTHAPPPTFAGEDAPPTRSYYTPERYPPEANPPSPPIDAWTDTHPLVGATLVYSSDHSWICGIVTHYYDPAGPTTVCTKAFHILFDEGSEDVVSLLQLIPMLRGNFYLYLHGPNPDVVQCRPPAGIPTRPPIALALAPYVGSIEGLSHYRIYPTGPTDATPTPDDPAASTTPPGTPPPDEPAEPQHTAEPTPPPPDPLPDTTTEDSDLTDTYQFLSHDQIDAMDPDRLIAEAADRDLHLDPRCSPATLKQDLFDHVARLAGAVVVQHRALGSMDSGALLLFNIHSALLRLPPVEFLGLDTDEDKRIEIAETIRRRQLREKLTPRPISADSAPAPQPTPEPPDDTAHASATANPLPPPAPTPGHAPNEPSPSSTAAPLGS